MTFFQKVLCVFQISKRKIFQITILNLKFEFCLFCVRCFYMFFLLFFSGFFFIETNCSQLVSLALQVNNFQKDFFAYHFKTKSWIKLSWHFDSKIVLTFCSIDRGKILKFDVEGQEFAIFEV